MPRARKSERIMNNKVRRRRINYFLPSESINTFLSLIGKVVTKFTLGTRFPSIDMFIESSGICKPDDLLYKSHGGPFFMAFGDDITTVIYGDDFLGSVVVREIKSSIDANDFLDVLESEDKTGERIRIRQMIDLSLACRIVGESVERISIFKLPDNFYYEPIGYTMKYESIVSIKFSNIGEILFVAEIRGDDGETDIRLATWESLGGKNSNFVTCIWSSE